MRSRTGFVLAAGAALLLTLPGAGRAQLSFDVGVEAVSQYVWREMVLADAFSLQPDFTVGFGESGLSLNIWGSFAVQDRDIWDVSDELDFTLSYDRALSDLVGLTLGYTQYTFPSAPEGSKHSEEAFLGLSFDHSLAPSVTAFYDFGLIEALYLTAGIAPEFAVGESLTLSLGLSAAVSDYALDEAGDNTFGFHGATALASLAIPAGGFTISPLAGFSYASDDIHPDNTEFWGGIGISFSR